MSNEISKLGFSDKQLSYLLIAVDSVIAYKNYKRSYNNTDDLDEKIRLQEIDVLRSIRKKIKEYIKSKKLE